MKLHLPKLAALLVAGALCASPAAAQQWFDFLGQADVPASVGGSLELYSIVDNTDQVPTPILLDLAGSQYTVVITGLTLDVDGPSQSYSGGVITIYEDSNTSGTSADYSVRPSFTDGTVIMAGVVTNLTRSMFTSTLGAVSGLVDWISGSRIDDIAPADRLGWAFVSGINASSSRTEPTYDERWDGKVEPQDPIVPIDPHSWGGVKSNFED